MLRNRTIGSHDRAVFVKLKGKMGKRGAGSIASEEGPEHLAAIALAFAAADAEDDLL